MTTAIILAGGLGTRLRSVVPDLPKPMAPIIKRPFLEYQMDFWLEQSVDHFVLSVGYKHEIITQHFGDEYRGAKIEYAVEETPLGTGGGLLLSLALLDNTSEPVLVLNGDTYFEVDFATLRTLHSEKGAKWSFSLFRANESGRYMGMGVDSTGRIQSLKSDTEQLGRLANGGVYLLDPNVVSLLDDNAGQKLSLEDDILGKLLINGAPMYGFEFEGTFIDIGVPDDFARAAQIMLR